MQREFLFLPFDHRATFEKGLFGIEGRKPAKKEVQKIRMAKQAIFDGVKLAIEKGVPKNKAAVLTDEGYGSHVLKQAKKLGITTAMPVEKSGKDVFGFDKGKKYREQIKRVNPDFVKVLVRYNPANVKDNVIQRKGLKELNDFLKKEKRKFLFELLVPAAGQQVKSKDYDSVLRPKLMVKAISELQGAGINPEIWKVEGVDKSSHMEDIVGQVKKINRNAVVIVLGRAESEGRIKKWFEAAAKVNGVAGFAVGRTVFMEPLKQYVAGSISREEAVGQIAANYMKIASLWKKFRKG